MGKLPITYIQGNNYLLLIYVYDANTILEEPLKSRSSSHILEAYTEQVKHVTNRGYRPRVHWLDNEASVSLKKYDPQEDIGYQLVPPQIHCVNPAERAIRAWKDYLIAGLKSIDTQCPMHRWCRLIQQETMNLNMLRPFR